ncbi:MAG TPA: Panacea domain-containing protein [Candidatus Angelobacter sp.]
MHYLKLLKLLYLADRAALLKWGRPITTDRYVSMDHGPVLSVTLNLSNGGYAEFGKKWDERISTRDGAEVELKHPDAAFAANELSQAEESLLGQIFDQYGHWNRWKVVHYLHTLPEWQDPNGSAIPISYRDILVAGKKSPAEISIIEEELESLTAVENILA